MDVIYLTLAAIISSTQKGTVCFKMTESRIPLQQPLSMIDGGHNALLVLPDFSAAFDTIDHTLLLTYFTQKYVWIALS